MKQTFKHMITKNTSKQVIAQVSAKAKSGMKRVTKNFGSSITFSDELFEAPVMESYHGIQFRILTR